MNHIARQGLRSRFWETTAPADMSRAEWEALCDGCGKCCLIKLEDEDTGDIAFTNIACRLFDDSTCSCGNYDMRTELVGGCVKLSPKNIGENAHWMPETCAYRVLHEGGPLPFWHPLETGRATSVKEAGVSIEGQTVAEYEVDEYDYEDYVTEEIR